MADYVAAQFGSEERYVLGDAEPARRTIELPKSHVRREASGAVRFYDLLRALLRLFARAVYVFPALVVVKLALWLAGVWWGDLLTVAFVALVVATFAVLALTVLMFAIVGPPEDRRTRLAFAAPRDDVFERAARTVPTRISGRVDAGLEPGAPVLVDQWTLGERLVRYVEGRSFVVVPDDGPPCAVEITGSPVIVGPHDEVDVVPPDGAARLGEHTPSRAARFVVRQGDRVEIVAQDVTEGAHLEDARLHALVESVSSAGPYRAADATATLVRCSATARTVIRVAR